jgi:hypothetical protein
MVSMPSPSQSPVRGSELGLPKVSAIKALFAARLFSRKKVLDAGR